jgi:hypothetical protein
LSDWGDYDNDGDLDLVVTGFDGSPYAATIYENQGGGVFAPLTNAGLAGVSFGSSGSGAWGDFDNDGDLDLVLTGVDSNFIDTATIYENVAVPPTATLALTGGSYTPPTPQPGTTGNPVARLELSASGAGVTLTGLTLDLDGAAPGLAATTAQGVEGLALWQSSSGTFDAATATPLPDVQTLDPAAPTPATITFGGLGASIPPGGTFLFLVADLAPNARGTLEPILADASDLTLAGATLTNGPGDFPLPLSSGAAPLPVELAAFIATTDDDGGVTLTWQTLSETNNAGFAVEQQQPDGTFAEVAFVEGAGTTTEVQTYRHAVPYVPAGRQTFRLRQVDFDGAAVVAGTVEVTVGLDGPYALAAYPNPLRAGTNATIDLTAREAQRVEVALYDVLGRRVAVLFDGEVAASETERLALPASGLASGVYVVRVVGERFQATRRVTVVR